MVTLATPAVYDVRLATGCVYTAPSWRRCLPGFAAVLLYQTLSTTKDRQS